MSSSILLSRTLHLVRNRSVTATYDVIAEDTGLKAHWVKAFANGRMRDPSVVKVETLYNYLNKSPLTLGDL